MRPVGTICMAVGRTGRRGRGAMGISRGGGEGRGKEPPVLGRQSHTAAVPQAPVLQQPGAEACPCLACRGPTRGSSHLHPQAATCTPRQPLSTHLRGQSRIVRLLGLGRRLHPPPLALLPGCPPFLLLPGHPGLVVGAAVGARPPLGSCSSRRACLACDSTWQGLHASPPQAPCWASSRLHRCAPAPLSTQRHGQQLLPTWFAAARCCARLLALVWLPWQVAGSWLPLLGPIVVNHLRPPPHAPAHCHCRRGRACGSSGKVQGWRSHAARQTQSA